MRSEEWLLSSQSSRTRLFNSSASSSAVRRRRSHVGLLSLSDTDGWIDRGSSAGIRAERRVCPLVG